MKIGTYYYPEQWPRTQWQRDFDNIAAMGLQIVHLAEFAWFEMEKEEGTIQLDWLNECLEMAKKRKLEVILCTPTAAPPIWLVEKYPEILPRDAAGVAMRFGGRRHYNPNSPAFRQATIRIVSALAERFGNHPSVIGWQIDNEYSHDMWDCSELSHKAFQQWLQRKYQTIDALNKAWGNQFWNTYYTRFDQILLPPQKNESPNPHQRLDIWRFWSWAFSDFNKLQAEILKKKVGNRFITTNFMPFHPDCNPADMAGDLTLMAWDSYPVAGWEKNPKDETFRMGNPGQIGFTHDSMAGFHNRFALMELQLGQVNWAKAPALPYPGAVRLWLWTALAHGAEFTTTYRYRQPLFNSEMWHGGLTTTDGVTPSPGGRQFMQVIQEVRRLKKLPAWTGEIEPKTTVGLYFDFEQQWAMQSLPQTPRWSQNHYLLLWYNAIQRMGLNVRILHPGQSWPKGLSMVMAPAVQLVDETILKQFTDFVATGGHLVLTCRTGLMDRSGQFFEGPFAKPILELIGGTIDAYDCLPEGGTQHVEMDGRQYAWNIWGDLLYAEPDTKVLVKYADGFYSGAAAAIQKRHTGGGTVSYCGLFADSDFHDAFFQRLLAGDPVSRGKKGSEGKLLTTPLPPRVQMLKRGPYKILLNYQDVTVDAPAGAKATFLVGQRKVEPAGVAVWEE